MSGKSNDNLTKALALLKQTARTAQAASRRPPNARKPLDIGELFLAELRVRRAHLQEWMEVLNSEAVRAGLKAQPAAGRATPRAGQARHRKPAARR
jgi:hypothetical protein